MTREPNPRRERLQRARLYLLLTESLCHHPLAETLEASLRGGVDVVQVREKNLSGAALRSRVARVLDQVAGRALVILNDDLTVAAELPVDGLHLGRDDERPEHARRVLGPDRLLGISTHDRREVEAARRIADYLGFGTVYPSRTRGNTVSTGAREAAAIQRLVSDRPVFAIGGIDEHNVHELARAGVRRIAVSRAILEAPDPEAVTRSLVQALGESDRERQRS